MEVRSIARIVLFDVSKAGLKDILDENASSCKKIQPKARVTVVVDVTRKTLITDKIDMEDLDRCCTSQVWPIIGFSTSLCYEREGKNCNYSLF
ncbi:hypothetical protein A4A49_59436 [Nicotiana attenuata]|uniref:Uncharacterized protein n=1 Tax=Nicotiana attenuata TaxID=49451 RepID=A0A314L269_NICAT|nr:hypothetical protein A4A49_59436 [Nicotiana attenuata]